MTISNKSRKRLWGKAGSRCAWCKLELCVAAAIADDESIVGDECHIVSGRPHGPRYDAAFSKEQLDHYDNLILLCKVHHKIVDDQESTYPGVLLRQMKSEHEAWVARKLDQAEEIPLSKVQRGDVRSLGRLVSYYRELMIGEATRQARRYNLVASDAGVMVQTVCARFLESPQGLARALPRGVEQYLTEMLEKEAAQMARERLNVPETDTSETNDRSVEWRPAITNMDVDHAIAGLRAELAPKQQAVLDRLVLGQDSARVVADELDVSLGSLKSVVSALRHKLAGRLVGYV